MPHPNWAELHVTGRHLDHPASERTAAVPATPSLSPITAIGDDRLPVVRPAQPSAGVGRTTTNRPHSPALCAHVDRLTVIINGDNHFGDDVAHPFVARVRVGQRSCRTADGRAVPGLFGSTVIGVEQTYKACGERRDDLPGLRQVLADRFEQVEVTMVGNVALFAARHPIEARQWTD